MAVALFDAVQFADDAVYAYWDGQGEETAERTIARGRDAIGAALTQTRFARPAVLVSVRDERNWFLEAAGGATFAASAQLDASGRVTRCLAFRCPPVAPPTSSSSTDGDGLAILERYFALLIAGELAAACECFSEDCLYSHPPYRPGTPRAQFRGRDELLEGFRETRGRRSSRPEIVCCVQSGADCFIEGVVENDAGPKGSFVSSVTLAGDGLIRRYVAFYTASRVPRR